MIFHAVHADCASLRSGDGTKLCGCLEHVTRDNKSLVLKQLWHVQTMVTLLQAGGGWKIPPPCPVSLLQLPLDIQTYHDIPKACHQARSTVVWDSVSMCLWIRKALPQANSPIARICFFQEWTTCWCEISDIKAYQTVALIHLARPAKRTSERSRHKTVTIQTVHPLVALHGDSNICDCQRMAQGILYSTR